MKNVLLIILAFWMLGCNKSEEALEPAVHYDHLYIIQDNPADSIQHKRYEIYQKYGVSVYFNDTVGRVYVKQNIHGDSVFHYETLDLAWGFTSHSDIDYSYKYITDPSQKMKGLEIMEEFLELANEKLYPFTVLITKSAIGIDNTGRETLIQEGAFKTNYRMLYLSGDWTEAQINNLPNDILKGCIKDKIKNYRDNLAEFEDVSNQGWYDEFWWDLDKTLPVGTDAGVLSPGWWKFDRYTPEQIAAMRTEVRGQIGPFGFVCGDLYSPRDYDADLDGYISEMTVYPKAQFEEYWGSHALVMKKYRILCSILSEKFDIVL